ncbi:MAG: hypothetical protein Q7S74_06010 [Nanoarchaeota archaeon]|nr:hypothetical protein [Nanoarchaeota archaeon]
MYHPPYNEAKYKTWKTRTVIGNIGMFVGSIVFLGSALQVGIDSYEINRLYYDRTKVVSQHSTENLREKLEENISGEMLHRQNLKYGLAFATGSLLMTSLGSCIKRNARQLYYADMFL